MKEVESKEWIVRCHCHDKSDHVIHIAQYDLTDEHGDDKMGQCVITTRLDPRAGLFKRAWIALKYMFGVGCYQYVETIIDVDILKEVVLQLEEKRTDDEKKDDRSCRTEVKVL